MPSTAHRRSVPSRTTRSAACASTRSSSDAFIFLKKAAALANAELRAMDPPIAAAIVRACDQILHDEARYSDQFVVDVFQAGAGTSFNMNCNEVIANLANVSLGGKAGEYKPVHPNDHVNMSQSTNDVFPTAIRIATLMLLGELARSSMRSPLPFTPRATSSPTSSSPAAPTCRMRCP